jgi:YD repeat-containing protein
MYKTLCATTDGRCPLSMIWPTIFFLHVLLLFPKTQISAQVDVEAHKPSDARDFVPKSPGATMFSVFGHTPVSHFTGVPTISVQLHDVAFKELDINLALNYHSSMGNRPESFPGPVGNGWLLTAGGAITLVSRGVHNMADLEEIETGYNPTAAENWASDASMQEYIQGRMVFVNERGRYDEYSYDFLGLSGKFYWDHNDQAHFKNSQGEDLKAEMVYSPLTTIPLPLETQGPPNSYSLLSAVTYSNSLRVTDFVSTFIITDGKGIRYTFGGTSESVEFSKPGLVATAYDEYGQNTIPTAWYLTSIESPNGYSITLNYERGEFYVTSESYCSGMTMDHSVHGNWSYQPATAKAIKSTATHPCYLKSIITPNSELIFKWSKAEQQLGYTHDTSPDDMDPQFPMYFYEYPEIKDAVMTNRYPKKLDKIEINVNGDLRKVIDFKYTNSSSTRLKLMAVNIMGPALQNSGYDHWEFGYNTTPLPAYMSFKTDKYGFYNGRNDYVYSSDPSYYNSLFNNATSFANYLASREPDPAYTQAEILTTIKYPTGGHTLFEYENHKYGRKAVFWPTGIQENAEGDSKTTGGLRIKKITNYDESNTVTSVKEYFYIKDYAEGGALSSGVLNYEPIFREAYQGSISAPARFANSPGYFDGNLSYQKWSTKPIYQASYYKGSHVTYSEVAEVNPDGSYTVYKYNNYDNGYHDQAALKIVCDNLNAGAFYREDDGNNMSLERGLLQAKLLYDDDNKLVKKTDFVYNTDPNRFNHHVRTLKAFPNSFYSVTFPSRRCVATLQYTYYPHLSKKVETTFGPSGEEFTTTTNYLYEGNNSRLLKEQNIVTNQNIKKRIIYRYPEDMVANGQTEPYTSMQAKKIVSTVIETEVRLGDDLLSINSSPYAVGLSSNSNVYAPAAEVTQYKTESPQTRASYHKYSHWGDLMDVSTEGGMNACYLWSYKTLYPVIKVLNASYQEVENVLGATVIQNLASASAPSTWQIEDYANQLRNHTSLRKARITHYIYDPLYGVTSETDPNGKTTRYEYDHLGRLHVVKDNDWNIQKVICYDYASQPIDCFIKHNTMEIIVSYASSVAAVCSMADFLTDPQKPEPDSQSIFKIYPVEGMDDWSSPRYFGGYYPSSPVPDGYYVESTDLQDGTYTYKYIVNGKVVYESFCGGVVPFIMQYKSSLPVEDPCAGDGIVKAIYTAGQVALAVGVKCYRSKGLEHPDDSEDTEEQGLTYVKDGYYFDDLKYFHIVNGTVVSEGNCNVEEPGGGEEDPGGGTQVMIQVYVSPTLAGVCELAGFLTDPEKSEPELQSIVRRFPVAGVHHWSGPRYFTGYYPSNPVPNGYYVIAADLQDGNYTYKHIVNGEIVSGGACGTGGGEWDESEPEEE